MMLAFVLIAGSLATAAAVLLLLPLMRQRADSKPAASFAAIGVLFALLLGGAGLYAGFSNYSWVEMPDVGSTPAAMTANSKAWRYGASGKIPSTTTAPSRTAVSPDAPRTDRTTTGTIPPPWWRIASTAAEVRPEVRRPQAARLDDLLERRDQRLADGVVEVV